MTFKGFNLSLELVLLLNELSINVLEVLNLTLQSRDFLLSQLKVNSAIILNVAELLASEELLVIQLGQLILALHVLMVNLLEVLDFSIKFLESSLCLIQLMSFLAYLDMHCCEVLIFMFARLSQSSNSTLAAFKIAF